MKIPVPLAIRRGAPAWAPAARAATQGRPYGWAGAPTAYLHSQWRAGGSWKLRGETGCLAAARESIKAAEDEEGFGQEETPKRAVFTVLQHARPEKARRACFSCRELREKQRHLSRVVPELLTVSAE